ncbi:inhibitor of nuclear factor kappa-B kinase subunit beta-like [Pollicipes pollicipes]|uniref:inhibitor of nuclear factor kappa-B kinase subunit beta-like n=1 Tax=Pollicipes pollicipes TaxID=41117 RepID=UPI001884D183|nr:inhibitor of nuclear factor kappa-B kinase subunit beta-like [Pollicipes pollicipes]
MSYVHDIEETEWVLYVFDAAGAEGGGSADIQLPPLVLEMLKDTEHRPAYYRQRAVYGQAVFLIQQQTRLLSLLQKAQHVHMMSLAGTMSRLTRLSERMTCDLARLQASSELFHASLGWDDENYSRQAAAGGVTSARVYGTWRQAGEQVRRRHHQSHELVQQLTAAVRDVTRRGTELQRVPGNRQKPDGFGLFYEKACEVYEAHRRRPKEQRGQRTSNAEMIRIVAKFIRNRSEPFAELYRVIGRQQAIQREVDELSRPLSEAIDGVHRPRGWPGPTTDARLMVVELGQRSKRRVKTVK